MKSATTKNTPDSKMKQQEIEMQEPQSKVLRTAINAAKAGAEKVLHYYYEGIQAELKADKTVLTAADHESEQVIIDEILKTFPDAVFLAEERGGEKTQETMWIVDPIDSTRSFQRGIPTWNVLVSYQEAGEIKLGVSYYPVLEDLYYAEKGKGTFRNGKPIHVSSYNTLASSFIGFGSQRHFADKQVLLDLIEASASSRSPDPTYTAALIAQGSMEGLVDAYGMPWDFAPYKVILEEAGGRITKLNGEPWTIDDSKGCVISNGLIHDELIEITRRYYPSSR